MNTLIAARAIAGMGGGGYVPDTLTGHDIDLFGTQCDDRYIALAGWVNVNAHHILAQYPVLR